MKRIFDSLKFEDVITTLVNNYNDQEQNFSGYLKAFNTIKNIKPEKHKFNDMSIFLDNVKDYNGDEFVDVCGYDRIKDKSFALDLLPFLYSKQIVRKIGRKIFILCIPNV